MYILKYRTLPINKNVSALHHVGCLLADSVYHIGLHFTHSIYKKASRLHSNDDSDDEAPLQTQSEICVWQI